MMPASLSGPQERRFLFTLLFLLQHLVTGNLLSEPNLRWTYDLESVGQGLSGRNLRKGNAVVAHKDGTLVFVTADDGSLHILQTNQSPPTSKVFEPETLAGKFTECRSGVSVVEETDSDGKITYSLVYAVVDTPIASGVAYTDGIVQGDDGSDDVSSRVIAVDLNGTLRWSVPVEGTVVGIPIPGQNAAMVYISRNVGGKGYLSVILTTSSTPEVTASLEGSGAPFGPPSLSLPLEGAINKNNGPAVTSDVLAVAESWGDGYVEDGGIYILLHSAEFEDSGGRGNESYELKLISNWPFSAVAPPLFRETSLWVGGTGSNVAGWTGNGDLSKVLEGKDDTVDPRWSIQMEPSERNQSQPLLSAPAISSDGSLLFLPGASNEFYCIQSDSGKEQWTDSRGSVVLAEPKVFEMDSDSVVYVIETLDGRVRQHDIQNGGLRNWEYNSCTDIAGVASCQESVEAEFSLAPTGNVIYYGDIFGRIVALEVANYETEAPSPAPSALPSASPSISPTTSFAPSLQPSASPTGIPSASPTEKVVVGGGAAPTGAPPSVFQTPGALAAEGEGGDSTKDDSNNLAMIVAVALSGALLFTVILLLIARSRNRETKKDVIELGSDAEDDLESAPTTGTITATSDSVEVEVLGGASVFSPKQRKSRKKKNKSRSPSTPQTLESIEEVPEDPLNDNTSLVLLDDDGESSNASVALDLNETFQLIAEVQTFEESSDDGSYAMSVETGSVGQSKDGTHLELSVGNNNLKPVEAETFSVDSKNSRRAKSPPPQTAATTIKDVDRQRSAAYQEEEKKESDISPTQLSPAPLRITIPTATKMSPAMEMSPNAQLSPLSTGSSVYLSGSESFDSKERAEKAAQTELSPNILSETLDEDVPEDEAKAMGSTRARLMMQQPSMRHQYNTHKRIEEAEAPDDELAAPGSHYMARSMPPVRKFSRPTQEEPSSARSQTSPGQGKYGKSVRAKRDVSGFTSISSNGSDSESAQDLARQQNKRPSFKRRSKREEKQPVKQTDTWGSFLNDLAAAEEAFFAPTVTQKSSILKYEDSSSGSEDTDNVDEVMART